MYACTFFRAIYTGSPRYSFISTKNLLKLGSRQSFRRGLLLEPSCSNVLFHVQHSACLSTSSHYSQNNKSVPTDKLLVYSGPLSRQVRRVKLFSLMTSMVGVLAQPAILERANELGATTGAIIGVCSLVGFFTFVTPFLLHWVTKKYVTSVVYNISTNSYTATTYSLFAKEKTLDFRPGEAIVPSVPGMFTTVTVNGTPLFLDARFFEDLAHYKKIMGYDRPMDFKLKQGTISPMDHIEPKKE